MAPRKEKLIAKYEINQKKSKILELITQGHTTNEIASQVGVSRQFVQDTLREELASTTTPEKILELREHQTQTLTSHTPRLHKRFIKQSDLSERLANKYGDLLDQDDEGIYQYSYRKQIHLDDGHDEETAHALAKREINEYREQREQIAREMERTAKLADQHYITLLKHQERLAKLNGLDVPQTQNILVHRRDEIILDVRQDILKTQKEIEATQPTIEAEIVEEEKPTDG